MNDPWNNDYKAYEGVTTQTPIDILEPEEPELSDYQKACRIFTEIISFCVFYIRTSNDPHLASIAVSYALGLHHINDGKPQRQTARELEIGHSTISNRVKKIEVEIERIKKNYE